MTEDKLIDHLFGFLKSIEWAGSCEGPGFGPMGSGAGRLYPCCPTCGGLKEANPDFSDDAVGHRPGCPLGLAVADKEATND